MFNITLGWIIDSGANQHMTVSTCNMFDVIDISCLNLTVGHPNGTVAKISSVGSLRLSGGIVLFDVLVVPEYNVSLLSVNKMVKDSKLFVGFDESKCYIQDLNLEKIVGTGSEFGGLYLFDDKIGKNVDVNCNSVFVCHASCELGIVGLGLLPDTVTILVLLGVSPVLHNLHCHAPLKFIFSDAMRVLCYLKGDSSQDALCIYYFVNSSGLSKSKGLGSSRGLASGGFLLTFFVIIF
ncbi:hypothetical protein Tco_1316969 [Tanacetum coccineum]